MEFFIPSPRTKRPLREFPYLLSQHTHTPKKAILVSAKDVSDFALYFKGRGCLALETKTKTKKRLREAPFGHSRGAYSPSRFKVYFFVTTTRSSLL